MGTHVNYSALVIAGIGFFLTRFTVTLAVYESSVRFYLAGVVPLALGLGLAAFGVALTVADVGPWMVRTTVAWCVVGAGTMFVLVVLTLLGSTPEGMADLATVRSRTYLSNFLIGGSVGGTLTGLYAAKTSRQRTALRRQANRLEVLNRMLRHEVLNAVAVIRGYATLEGDDHPDATLRIEAKSDAITEAIEEVKYLTPDSPRGRTRGKPVDLGHCLAESVDRVSDAHPDVAIAVDAAPTDPTVRATDRLGQVFDHLLENAAVHADTGDPNVEVSVTTTATTARVSVRDDGPGLPESQQALLETGDIEEYDDPGTGFGLNVVRLLVEEFGGEIETEVTGSGTTVTVVLERVVPDAEGLRLGDAGAVRPATPQLIVTLVAAVVAGVFYGLAAEALGGSVGFIGVYYGVQNAVVGWITHEFHSVVFAFAFASLVSLVPRAYHDRISTYVVVGTAWGLFLWVFAAGVVSPAWLRLLGIPASIPTFSMMLLASHLAWGSSLGLLTALGYRYLAPWLGRLV